MLDSARGDPGWLAVSAHPARNLQTINFGQARPADVVFCQILRFQHVQQARTATSTASIERRSGHDRRSLSMRTFLQGGLTPRRRNGRRANEHHSIVDWHDPHTLTAVLLILLLSLTDAFLTLTLMTHGATEANPLLAYLLESHPALFASVKQLLTGVGLLVLVALGRIRVFRVVPVRAIMHLCLACYIALIGYEWSMLRALV
jgi:hypothetical protein